MDTHVVIRILDTDGRSLAEAEARLRRFMRAYRVAGEVHPVGCFLEIERHGLVNHVPALQVNGLTVRSGAALTDAVLEDCCARLARWQKEKARAETVAPEAARPG